MQTEALIYQRKLAPALLEGETIKWVGRPVEMHWVLKRFWKIHDALIITISILALIVDIFIPWIWKRQPLALPETWSLPGIVVGFAAILGFRYLWMRQFKSARYFVTNMRALIYFPKWGKRWKWSPKRGFRRDYTDPETSPISGGYITHETIVQRDSIDGTYGIINIFNMDSDMSDAKSISLLKKVIPSLDGIIYDSSNLMFGGLVNAEQAEKEITKIIDQIKRNLEEPPHARPTPEL